MRKHYLTLNCTQEETEYRLKQQLRIYPPKGIVEERSFKIYKHSPGHFVVNGIHESLFCFYGNYRQDGNRTNLAYRIRPGFSIFLMYLLLTLLTLFTTLDVLINHKPFGTILIPLGFFLTIFLIMQAGKKKCITDFEKQLTAQTNYHK